MTINFPRAAFGSVRAEAPAQKPSELITQLVASVNELRETQEANLKAHDAVNVEKIEKLQANIDDLQAKIDDQRKEMEEQAAKLAASVAGPAANPLQDAGYSKMFANWFRDGDAERDVKAAQATGIRADLNKGANAEGGFLAPVEWDRSIGDKLVQISPMRSIATVQPTSVAGFKKLFNLKGTASGWVGETAARPETATATFGEMAYGYGEIYANPAATQQMLDDAQVDLESWLAGEVEQEFALQEGVAFLSGNGTNRPTGILTYVTGAANATAHPYGAITTVNTGLAAAVTADGVVNLVYDLPSEFTANARFIMNRNTQRQIRLLKDGQDNYLWQPSYVAGQPSTLLGYPITEMPGMPDVAANSIPMLFGDFARGYLILDRMNTRVLRDPYTNKPYVHFYTTKGVGGGLLNPEVLRAAQVAA